MPRYDVQLSNVRLNVTVDAPDRHAAVDLARKQAADDLAKRSGYVVQEKGKGPWNLSP